MDRREYHLAFCRICENRKQNLKSGIVCSINDKIADFEDNCSSFKLDKPELQKLKNRFQSETKDKYATNTLESFITKNSFHKPTKLKRAKYKSAEQTHGLKFRHNNNIDKGLFIVMTLSAIYLIYRNYNDIIQSTVDNGIIAGIGVLIALALLMFYRGYFHKYKIKISIDHNGINYDQKKIFWNNILDFGIIETKGRQFNENKIIIGTISKGIIEIDLSHLDVTPEDFVEIIQLNRKTFYNNVYN